MRSSVLALFAFFFALHLNGETARSVSTSGQFIVYGLDVRARGAICDVAEDTKRAALQLLQERDAWKTPIIINAQLPRADAPELPRAQLDVSQTGNGLKLQLDLRIDTDANLPAIERELLRAIFIEMIYRGAPNTPAGVAYVQPPDWLLDGTLAANRDPAEIANALRTPLESESIVSLGELLNTRADLLDAPSRELFDAYADALISALTESPENAHRLGRFISDLPQSSNDAVADFRAHFPAFGETPEAMQKQWVLTIAQRAESERYRFLSANETEQQLARILRFELREADQPIGVYGLEEYPHFAKLSAARDGLRRMREELLLLSGRANPIYRPLLAEYGKIVEQLARGKAKRLAERLASLRATREQLSREMNQIADYMNWFEATQSHAMSGEFRDYLKTAAHRGERDIHRHDAISVYLDALETEL